MRKRLGVQFLEFRKGEASTHPATSRRSTGYSSLLFRSHFDQACIVFQAILLRFFAMMVSATMMGT